MPMMELRCPNCTAPVDTSDGTTQRCAYCGASLVMGTEIEFDRHDEFFVTLEIVGPSNRERVVRLLAAELELEPAATGAMVDELPADVGNWERDSAARRLCEELEANGAVARVGKRVVEVRRPPRRSVFLEDAGGRKISVVKVLRQHLPLGLKEAKELAESAPCQLANGLDGVRADALRDDLVAAGARVRLE